MADEFTIVPYYWRRGLIAARLALGVLWFALQLFFAVAPGTMPMVCAALFAAYGLAGYFWRNAEQVRYSLLSLVLDIIFFLLFTVQYPPAYWWLSTAFLLYLLAQASVLHGVRETMVVGLVCTSFFVILRPMSDALTPVTVLTMSGLTILLSAQKKILMDRLSGALRQAMLFRSEAEKARESERQRIAADFHDGPLQSFMSFQMRLEIARKMLDREHESGMKELRQLQDLCRSQVGELRSFVRSMRPVEVDGASLSTAIRRLVEAFEKDAGIPATFIGGEPFDVPEPEASLEVIQLVREALHNVQKHSKASRVAVGVDKVDDTVELSIEDDGVGFPFSGAYNLEELDLLRLGPASIKRRVRSLGGQLQLESQPGRGAGIKIWIPA